MKIQRLPRGPAVAAGSGAVVYAVLHQLWLRSWIAESSGVRSDVPTWAIAIAFGVVLVATSAVAGLSAGPQWRWVTIVTVGCSFIGGSILASFASYAFERADVFKDVTPAAQLLSMAPLLVGGAVVCALLGLVPAWCARKLAKREP